MNFVLTQPKQKIDTFQTDFTEVSHVDIQELYEIFQDLPIEIATNVQNTKDSFSANRWI